MPPRLNEREWVEKYQSALQNERIIQLINRPELKSTPLGSWSFLKLAVLWSFADHIYSPIIGKNYPNMCYVDLFSGSGLVSFNDRSNTSQLLIGSPILMATLKNRYPFQKCYFFEKYHAKALEQRLSILKSEGLLTCKDFEVIPEDCNNEIDSLIEKLHRSNGTHFLLFIDPFSTEIEWSTMEKLLTMEYPAFDMIFNFQPFGINRQIHDELKLTKFFGDEGYKKCWLDNEDNRLNALRDYYIRKLKQFPKKIKTIPEPIRIKSGTGGFYYDLIYSTRKDDPSWIQGLLHLGKMIERISGAEVSIIFDKTQQSLY